MTPKIVCDLKSPEYKERLIDVLTTIKDVVASTIGPEGRNCILFDGIDSPHITKDGVTVAEFLSFDDPFEEAINRVIKETARKTAKEVGDGTTTSVLLACEMCIEVLKTEDHIHQLQALKAGVAEVVKFINITKTLLDKLGPDTADILKSIVYLSSNGDEGITDLIMEAVERVGVEGLIDVVESDRNDSIIDVKDGMLIEAPVHINNSREFETPVKVVLVSDILEHEHQIVSLLKMALADYSTGNIPYIVIAKEFSKNVVAAVDVNNRSNKIDVTLVESDGFGQNLLDILEDIGMLVDAKIHNTIPDSPFSLQNIERINVGLIDGAVVTRNSAVLYKASMYDKQIAVETKSNIIAKIKRLHDKGSDNVGEIKHLEKRLTKFIKSATIHVGGATKVEMVERKDRVDDAVQAMQASIRGGVIPGAGSTLYLSVSNIADCILKRVCESPAQLLAGIDYDTIKLLFHKGEVMDYRSGDVGNAMALGILDPADVQIKAIEQALAITTILTKSRNILIPKIAPWQEV